MSMADPHRNNPESTYYRPLADPIRDNADHAGGHHWTPTDFKSAKQPDPEHLDRRGLLAEQGKAFRQAILDEASAVVTGAREDTYGGPEQSFRTIAGLWSAYLGQEVSTHDVAAMMALLKLARIKHSEGQHRDSWTDLAGYAACGAECAMGPAGG